MAWFDPANEEIVGGHVSGHKGGRGSNQELTKRRARTIGGEGESVVPEELAC